MVTAAATAMDTRTNAVNTKTLMVDKGFMALVISTTRGPLAGTTKILQVSLEERLDATFGTYHDVGRTG